MIGQSAGKSYAYLLGVYLGDGALTDCGYGPVAFRLNVVDMDFAEATASALEAVTGKRPNIRTSPVKNGRDNHAITLTDRPLAARLLADTEAKKRIPMDVIAAWPRDWQMAFVAGLMDSEGFVAENRGNPTNRRFYMGFKCTADWVPDFIVLIQSLGIRIGKVQTEAPRKEGYRAPTRFLIKMQSWIDSGGYFHIDRKQRRVTEWGRFGAYERRAAFPRRLTSEANMPDPATLPVKIESELRREA